MARRIRYELPAFKEQSAFPTSDECKTAISTSGHSRYTVDRYLDDLESLRRDRSVLSGETVSEHGIDNPTSTTDSIDAGGFGRAANDRDFASWEYGVLR